tara:strand:+ start:3461 stop:5185 length:1725 start_codon:yes stop_codon:yes gene_type:complete
MNKIKLGYKIETEEEVGIKPSHLIVTGLTQEAGKTTTLEALIKRSGKRAIVFKTKVGEKSFLEGTIIPPYFKDKSDWQFVQGLIEATIKEKMRSFERAKIIQLCKKTGGKSLLEFKKKVDERLLEKINSFEMDILTNIQAYLEIVLPKLQSINFSQTLELNDGLNIIDLERFSRDSEVQSLIIRSVLEEVLYNFKDVIVVIPEAWKFAPQGRGNPCKQMMEEFIRQGATNGNFIWIDSQDMSNVDKVPLKQISTWILGYQSERNEVKHTIDQIPLPKKSKPNPDDIQNLGKGIFYLATRDEVIKTYVQPYWLDDKRAKQIAMGKLKIEEIDAPETITPFKVAVKKETRISEQPTIDFSETTKRFNKELNEMRNDFFNKLEQMQEQFSKIYSDIFEIKNQPRIELDEETIINKVLQKVPTTSITSSPTQIDEESIISKVLARVPKGQGNVVYEVAPLEKIKKDFLEEAKNKILDDISSLSNNAKKSLKYLESVGKSNTSQLATKCFLYPNGQGGYSKIILDSVKELEKIQIIKLDTKNGHQPKLKERIKFLLEDKEATEQEIEQIYNHILMEILM